MLIWRKCLEHRFLHLLCLWHCKFYLKTLIVILLRDTLRLNTIYNKLGVISTARFSISYLEAQVFWNFSSKSLESFLSSLQVTWKPTHLAKSRVTSVADLGISWVTQTSLFVFCIFLNQYRWHYVVCFTTYLQKVVKVLFIDKLGVRCLRCCIKWRHYSVDAWRHNSVDAGARRR